MKNIKRKLLNESNNLLPDENFKNMVKAEAIGKTAPVKEKTNRTHGKRNMWVSLAAAAAVIVFMTVLPAVIISKSKGGNGGNGGGQKNPVVIDATTKETYAFGACSAGLILSGGTSGAASAAESEKELVNADIEFLGRAMSLVEGIMASLPQVSETTSDRLEFSKKMTVSQGDLLGGTHAYALYYNENIEEDEDDEVESSISGILIIGENEFTVEGKREKEDGEYEVEMKVLTDENNYVTFNQEIEGTEFGYAYSVYKDGNLFDSFEIEWEKTGGTTAVEMLVLKENGADVNVELEYTVPQDADVQIEIEAKYFDNSGNETGVTTVIVEINEDKYIFSYNNGTGKSELLR